jgi:hypothetical protein
LSTARVAATQSDVRDIVYLPARRARLVGRLLHRAEALHYWCRATDRDEDELTHDQKSEFEAFWSTWRHDNAWEGRDVALRVHGRLDRRTHRVAHQRDRGEEQMGYRYVITTRRNSTLTTSRAPVGDARVPRITVKSLKNVVSSVEIAVRIVDGEPNRIGVALLHPSLLLP